MTIVNRPFLVGAGHLSNDEMRAGSSSLASGWGSELIEYSCIDNPIEILNSLPKKNCLIQLLGDAAMLHPEGGSWLESLGAWRQPIILKVITTPSGDVPGTAAAYKALCEFLGVPLLGLIQFGGNWNHVQRRLDGLPWLGWLPSNTPAISHGTDLNSNPKDEEIDRITLLLNHRLKKLGS